MRRRIVLDTNVLVAALRSSKGASYRLLSIIDSDRINLNVSTPLVAEYEEILKRVPSALSSAEIDDIIDYLCSIAEKHKIFYLWRPILKDADDDFLLELAVKAGADIITWNKDDFRRAAKFKVKVMTPAEFLHLIGETP